MVCESTSLYKHYLSQKKTQYKYEPNLFIVFFPLTYRHFIVCISISKPVWLIRFELIKSLKPSQLFVYAIWFYFDYLVKLATWPRARNLAFLNWNYVIWQTTELNELCFNCLWAIRVCDTCIAFNKRLHHFLLWNRLIIFTFKVPLTC